MMSTKAELLAGWYRDVWENGDLEAISRYLHPDAQAAGIVPELNMDVTEFRELVGVMLTLIEDISVKIVHSVEQNDWICALLHLSCKQIEENTEVTVYTQTMVRFEDGMVAESYNTFDFLAFFEQLGQIPPNGLALLMCGTRLS